MEHRIDLKSGACLDIEDIEGHAPGTVVICPGGGYEWVSPREAEPVAREYRKGGWNTAILRYTVRGPGDGPLGNIPLLELAEAVKLIREQSSGQVVVCGFSAGGHLAASLGVHWRNLNLPAPDALILGYPVITAGEYAHRRSITNLSGDGDPGFYSLELHAGPQVPPTFLWHTVTDPSVPVENSVLFAEALIKAGVECELHLYPRGTHGLSLATPEVSDPAAGRLPDPHVAGWMDMSIEWLNNYIKR